MPLSVCDYIAADDGGFSALRLRLFLCDTILMLVTGYDVGSPYPCWRAADSPAFRCGGRDQRGTVCIKGKGGKREAAEALQGTARLTLNSRCRLLVPNVGCSLGNFRKISVNIDSGYKKGWKLRLNVVCSEQMTFNVPCLVTCKTTQCKSIQQRIWVGCRTEQSSATVIYYGSIN